MKKSTMVWSDEKGDLRKSPDTYKKISTDNSKLIINLRRLSAGKGRTVIELSGLPSDDSWCSELAKKLKKSLAAGGTYKNNRIEIHLDDIDKVTSFLDKNSLKWKKTGG